MAWGYLVVLSPRIGGGASLEQAIKPQKLILAGILLDSSASVQDLCWAPGGLQRNCHTRDVVLSEENSILPLPEWPESSQC